MSHVEREQASHLPSIAHKDVSYICSASPPMFTSKTTQQLPTLRASCSSCILVLVLETTELVLVLVATQQLTLREIKRLLLQLHFIEEVHGLDELVLACRKPHVEP